MITEIGLVAGDIWNYLEDNGKSAKLTDIIENVQGDISKEMMFMSIGWLAREGHVIVDGAVPDCTISLTG